MQKLGVVFFHKNINNIYKFYWIEKCISSMLNQTNKDFTIYEICYGKENYSVFSDHCLEDSINFKKNFYHIELDNHALAMNYIISKAFDDGCDYVFNTNMDDFYLDKRIETQLKVLDTGIDLVSSDFCYINEQNGIDSIIHYMNIRFMGSIYNNLLLGNNIVAHPCVAFTRNFWNNNKYIDSEIPFEDMKLWKRALESGYKFKICDEELLFYRIHENQISSK